MALFEPKYRYIHNEKSSRDYLSPRAVAREGCSKLPNRDANFITVGTENFPGKRVSSLRQARRVVVRLLKEKPIGIDIVVRERRKSDGSVVDQVRFRKTQKRPVADTPGNVYLDRVEGWIEETFPRARWAGDCVCKPQSDHASCRAVDYFDTADNMVKMRNGILANHEWFGYTYVILFDRIWFGPDRSEHYSGVYHSHIHVSVGGSPVSAC